MKKLKRKNTTRKKVKVIGGEKYQNLATGEVQDTYSIFIQEKDANFHKIWLEHIIQSIDIIGNQKIRFAFWLIEHMNRENQITMTYRQMTKASGVSLDTVQRTIKALMDADFLRRYNQGCYQVNPDVVWKGGSNDRMNILLQYQSDNDDEENEETEENSSEE